MQLIARGGSPLSYSGKHGRLFLELESKNGKSVIGNQFFKVPLQVIAPSYLDDSGDPFVQIVNPTGGIVGGDRLEMEVVLREGSSCLLTTQSATKVYRTLGPESVQTSRFEVGRGARLEYLPHPVIPFAGSDFVQRTDVYLHPDGVFLMGEVMTPGRSSRGESFQYKKLRSSVKVFMENRLVLLDSFSLSPESYRLNRIGVLGSYTHVGSLYAFLPDLLDEFLIQLNEGLMARPDQYAGATRLKATGFLARILGTRTYQVQETIMWIWSEVRTKLLNLPVPFFRQY
jgi:urease accessory protein